MLFYKKCILALVSLWWIQLTFSQAPTAEELVGIHPLTETQINAIANPIIGTLVFNTDTNLLQTYTGGAWEIPESVSTFEDNLDGTFTYTDENGDSITIGTVGPQGPPGAQGPPGTQGPPGNSTVTNLSQATGTGVITYTNEDNTSQTANVVSTDANNTITAGSDGGAFIPSKLIDVYDSNSSYTVSANTFRKVRFNTTRLNQGGIFTLSNNEITINEAGTYEIEYGVSARTNVWSYIEAKLRVNGVDLPATSSYNGGWYKNSTATRKIYQILNANDVISVWVQRLDQSNSGGNSVTTLDDGSSLLIRRLN